MTDIIRNLYNRDARFVAKDDSPIRVTIFKRVTGEEDGECIDAELFDVSTTGAKLRAAYPIQIKESVSLEITAVDSGQELCVAGSICWVSPASADEWWIGCQFDPTIPAEALLSFAEEGLLERRQSDRLPVSVDAKAKWELNQVETDVKLTNVSSGGFCLETAEKQRAGSRVLVFVESDNGGDRIAVKGKALWQVTAGDAYVVGCEFQDERGCQALANLRDAVPATGPESPAKVSVWRRLLGKS